MFARAHLKRSFFRLLFWRRKADEVKRGGHTRPQPWRERSALLSGERLGAFSPCYLTDREFTASRRSEPMKASERGPVEAFPNLSPGCGEERPQPAFSPRGFCCASNSCGKIEKSRRHGSDARKHWECSALLSGERLGAFSPCCLTDREFTASGGSEPMKASERGPVFRARTCRGGHTRPQLRRWGDSTSLASTDRLLHLNQILLSLRSLRMTGHGR